MSISETASKDSITPQSPDYAEAVGKIRAFDVGPGVSQVYFRIPPDLQQRVRDRAHRLDCPQRALWIVAMEQYLAGFES